MPTKTPTPKINRAFFKNLPKRGRYYADAEVKGLRGWLAKDGTLTFTMRTKIKGAEPTPLGAYHPEKNNLEKVRAAANLLRFEWSQLKTDPLAAAKKRRAANIPTLRELIVRYRKARLSGDKLAGGRAKGLPKDWDEQVKRFEMIVADLLDLLVSHITREQILECTSKYIQNALHRDPLDDKSLRGMMGTVAPMFGYAAAMQWMEYSETVKLVPEPYPPRTRFLLPGELQRIPDAWDSLPDDGGCFPRFIFNSGCRPGMVHELEWADVDPQVRTLTERGVTAEVAVWRVPESKMKAGYPSIVLLVGEALAIYRKFKAEYEAHPDEGRTTVFPMRILRMWEHNGARWQKLVNERSGTDEWYRHDLRRTLATYLKYLRLSQGAVSLALSHTLEGERSNPFQRADRAAAATAVYTVDDNDSIDALDDDPDLPTDGNDMQRIAFANLRAQALFLQFRRGERTALVKEIETKIALGPKANAMIARYGIHRTLIDITAAARIEAA